MPVTNIKFLSLYSKFVSLPTSVGAHCDGKYTIYINYEGLQVFIALQRFVGVQWTIKIVNVKDSVMVYKYPLQCEGMSASTVLLMSLSVFIVLQRICPVYCKCLEVPTVLRRFICVQYIKKVFKCLLYCERL